MMYCASGEDEAPETEEERAARKAAKEKRRAEKAAEKAERKAAKAAKKAAKGDAQSPDDDAQQDDEDDDDANDSVKSSAASQSTASKSKSKSKTDDWHLDTSKEAVKARQEIEFANAKAAAERDASLAKLTLNESSDSPVAELKLFLNSRKRSPEEVMAELKRIAVSRELDERAKLKVLINTLLVDPSATAKQIATTKFTQALPLLSAYTSGDRSRELQLLYGLEELVAITDIRLLPLTGHCLQSIYEGDCCDEDAIIEWFNSPVEASLLEDRDATNRVKAKAAEFVNWLQEADEESGSEDEVEA
jgi:translation initiation factor 5